MSGYGGCDDEALHAMIMSENEVDRVRAMLHQQQQRPSQEFCIDCDDEIPELRQKLIPGVQHCVVCAPKYEVVKRPKMLDHIL